MTEARSLTKSQESLCTPVQKKRKTNITFCNPDHQVIQLKYENYDDFEEIIVSNLTRHLDLSGTHLDDICGEFDPNHASGNKYKTMIKDMFSLKKREERTLAINDELIRQIGQLTSFLSKSLTVQGIFRQNGSSAREQQLVTALNTGAWIDFDKSQFTPHDAADVLKSYLSKLVHPLLLPSKYFEAHFQIAQLFKMDVDNNVGNLRVDAAKRIECLQLLLLLLPTEHRQLCQGIMELFAKVAKTEGNKMDATNLGKMLMPNILLPINASANFLKENHKVLSDHVAFMIHHTPQVFSAPQYIRDKARRYFPFHNTPNTMSPDVRAHTLVPPSSASKNKRRLSVYEQQGQHEAVTALNELYQQAKENPDSACKRKLVKNYDKHFKAIEKGRKMQVKLEKKDKKENKMSDLPEETEATATKYIKRVEQEKLISSGSHTNLARPCQEFNNKALEAAASCK